MCERCELDYRRTGCRLVGWATPDGKPPIDKMRRLGREFGYPECCIEAFIATVLAGCSPGSLRGSLPVPGRPEEVYVPCNDCRAREAVAA